MPSSSSLLDVGCCWKGSDLEGLELVLFERSTLRIKCCYGGVASWVSKSVKVG